MNHKYFFRKIKTLENAWLVKVLNTQHTPNILIGTDVHI